MTQTELIKQEIERRIALYKESNYGISIRSDECNYLLSFIESLEEEHDVDLDIEIDRFIESVNNEATIDETAKYFYELGKKHRV